MNQTNYSRNKRIGNYRLYFKKRICSSSLFSRFLGKNQINNDLVTIKIVPKNLLLQQVQLKDTFLKEWNILKTIQQKHVLMYKDIVQTTNNIYIIEQLTNQRSLQTMLSERHSVPLPEHEVLQILHQICLGFSQLKKHGIQFNSLKPSAVLFIQNTVKLDGFSCIYFDIQQDYVPPGAMNNLSTTDLRNINIWSLGIIAYRLLFGCFPSEHRKEANQQNRLENQINFPLQIPVSQLTKDFIKKCLRNKSEDRLSIEDALGHKVFHLLDSRNKTQIYSFHGFKKKKTF